MPAKKRTKKRSPKAKKAIISGITGQDGSYLAEFLLAKGYEVHGLIRRSSNFNTARIEHLYSDFHVTKARLKLHYSDLLDVLSIQHLIDMIEPDEFYNLGAQSHVRVSFDLPEYTANVTGLGVMRVLEAIRNYEKRSRKRVKFYQASSSEMFGKALPPQSEKTHFHPRSPYGIAKVFAFHTAVHYREAHGMFVVNGILFNHESERRGETFVTRKVTKGIARIKAGLDTKLYLGNLDAKRDWGYAPEYMEAAWLMLQQKIPRDYVIGTGESHTVKEFVKEAFLLAGMPNWKKYVEIDKRYFRPTEVDHLVADTRFARRKLGWKPKVKFKDLVKLMVEADLKAYGITR